jgi:hypothetical protein
LCAFFKPAYGKVPDRFAAALICFYIPVGVLGFYICFVTFVTTILGILLCVGQRTQTEIITELLHIAFYSLQIYQNTSSIMAWALLLSFLLCRI